MVGRYLIHGINIALSVVRGLRLRMVAEFLRVTHPLLQKRILSVRPEKFRLLMIRRRESESVLQVVWQADAWVDLIFLSHANNRTAHTLHANHPGPRKET